MKLQRSPKGFTLIELLVVISIIAILASLAVPAVTSAMVKGQLVQTMNNSRQIYLASFSMAADAVANNDNTMGWPLDASGTATSGSGGITKLGDYITLLVSGNYMRAEDVKKVLSAPGVSTAAITGTGTSISGVTTTTSAFSMNQIGDTSPSNSLFLCTKNFSPSSPSSFGQTANDTVVPYGNKGYILCRKGGDVGIYKTAASGTASYSGSITLMQ